MLKISFTGYTEKWGRILQKFSQTLNSHLAYKQSVTEILFLRKC